MRRDIYCVICLNSLRERKCRFEIRDGSNVDIVNPMVGISMILTMVQGILNGDNLKYDPETTKFYINDSRAGILADTFESGNSKCCYCMSI